MKRRNKGRLSFFLLIGGLIGLILIIKEHFYENLGNTAPVKISDPSF